MSPYEIVLTLALVLIFAVFARTVKKLSSRQTRVGAQAREAKLIEIYDRLEGLMDSFEDYLGEVREDIDDKRDEVRELARQIGAIYARMTDAARPRYPAADPAAYDARMSPDPGADAPSVRQPPPGPPTPMPDELSPPPARGNPARSHPPPPEGESRLSKRDRAELMRFATKPQKVRFLMSRGLPLEEVARELDIGKGEVRLIADLEK